MSDTRKASLSIPISAKQTVRPTGTPVTQSNWNPVEGESRKVEIEQARAKALEDHKRYLEDASTVGQRLVALENEVATLRDELQKLVHLLVK
jgi:hypothetical protein